MIADSELCYLVASDVEPVKQFLLNAFASKNKGDANHYNHIISQLFDRDDPEMVWKVYLALGSCVSQFTQK